MAVSLSLRPVVPIQLSGIPPQTHKTLNRKPLITRCKEDKGKEFWTSRRNLVLIGGRGCGKSSIARRLLATDKRFTLLGLDELIVYEAGGKDIPEIVQERGWSGFRDLEYEVVAKASSVPEFGLLDCGGGVCVDLQTSSGKEIFSDRKVGALRKSGLVVYIQRDINYLLGRIQGDSNRPDLSASLSFTEIMKAREPFYIEAADLVVDARGKKKKSEIATEVLTWFYNNVEEPRVESKWYSVWRANKANCHS